MVSSTSVSLLSMIISEPIKMPKSRIHPPVGSTHYSYHLHVFCILQYNFPIQNGLLGIGQWLQLQHHPFTVWGSIPNWTDTQTEKTAEKCWQRFESQCKGFLCWGSINSLHRYRNGQISFLVLI